MKKKPFKALTKGITSFEDVLARRGDKVEDILPYANPKTIRQFAANDRERLDYCAEYLQQDWKADWKNRTQKKWFSVFEHNGSGFGFLRSLYDDWYAYTLCGSRLCQETEELSDFFGKTFITIHTRLLTNNYKTKKS